MAAAAASIGGLFVPCRKGSAVPFITAEEKSRYDKTFLSLLGAVPSRPPNQALLGGEKVKEVFLLSGLPAKTLGLIWEKSDLTKDGKLCEREFAIAMCLIEHVLGGHTVPATLPQQLLTLTGTPVNTPPVNTPSSAVTSQAAAAPGGPPPQSQFSQDAFGGGFGNSFIPGAPVARGGFPSGTPAAPPPQMPPPLAHPNTSSTIDAAFGGGAAAPKLYPTLPPAVPMRNDMKAAMTMPVATAAPPPPVGAPPTLVGVGGDPFAQPVPPRRDSLALNMASSDWLVPPASRNKYRQQFSLNDPGRTGIMGANLARNILLQTNVDTNILARIWDLSNLRGQGNLNPDEFTLAMHLCDLVKAGESLPPTLPPLLVPPSMREHKMHAPGTTMDVSSTSAEQQQPAQKQPLPVSFEDKLRQNFDRGEAALEEKRKALLEQERREKEERMMKERQEEERRARERAEQERKRAEQWAEQQRRLEEARKEAEAKAQAEHDRRIALTLESRIAAARSHMTQLRSHNSQLDSDIQVLAAKKRSLDEQLGETRGSEQRSKDCVRDRGDKYAARKRHLEQLQQQLQEFQRSLKQFTDKRMSIAEQLKQQSVRTPIAERHSQVMASLEAQKRKVERLRTQVEGAEKETADKFRRVDQLNAHIGLCKHLLEESNTTTTQTGGGGTSDSPVKSSETKWGATSDPFGDAFGAAAKAVTNGSSSDPFAAPDLFKAVPSTTTNSTVDPFSSAAAAAGVTSSSADPFSAATPSHDLFSNHCTSNNNTFGTTAATHANNLTSFNVTSKDSTVAATVPAPSSASNGGSESEEVYFEALYDFGSTDEGDLPFKAGDVIAASAQQNLQEAWLAGFLNGVGGWFPQNYTRRLQHHKPVAAAAESTSQHPQSAVTACDVTDQGANSSNQPPSSSTPQILCRVRAAYPFEASAEGDLTLAVGDEVQVTCKDGDWWTGFLATDPAHTLGIFPCNFVEQLPPPTPQSTKMATSGGTSPCPSSSATTPQTLTLPGGGADSSGAGQGKELASVMAEFHGDSPEQLSLSVGDVVIVKKKLDSGWWEGQIQGEKKKGWFPGDYVRLISSGLTPLASANSSPERKAAAGGAGASSAATADHAGAGAERVRAQFAFTAEREDELTFNVGDVINILSKDDPDWWKGELRGHLGLFPSNFVSPL